VKMFAGGVVELCGQDPTYQNMPLIGTLGDTKHCISFNLLSKSNLECLLYYFIWYYLHVDKLY